MRTCWWLSVYRSIITGNLDVELIIVRDGTATAPIVDSRLVDLINLLSRKHVWLALFVRVALSRYQVLVLQSVAWRLLQTGQMVLFRCFVLATSMNLSSFLTWELKMMVVGQRAGRIVCIGVRSLQLRHIMILMAHDQLAVLLMAMRLGLLVQDVTVHLSRLLMVSIIGLAGKAPHGLAVGEAWRRRFRGQARRQLLAAWRLCRACKVRWVGKGLAGGP